MQIRSVGIELGKTTFHLVALGAAGVPMLPLQTITKQLADAIGDTLGGQNAAENEALSFLDGFYKRPLPIEGRRSEPQRFELWLRGLLPGVGGGAIVDQDDFSSANRFEHIVEGMESWARKLAFRYWQVSSDSANEAKEDAEASFQRTLHSKHPSKRHCDSPVASRLALLDFYYLAQLLQAEVTPAGTVSYRTSSWIALLSVHAKLSGDQQRETRLHRLEDILRSVFSLACELVQNAAELREVAWNSMHERVDTSIRTMHAKSWRFVQDEELAQVGRQRRLRSYKKIDEDRATDGSQQPATEGGIGWSRRLYSSDTEHDVVGPALSGGNS
jgi:hypothetical protein